MITARVIAIQFASEVVLSAARAIIAQFVESGLLAYGPRVQFIQAGYLE